MSTISPKKSAVPFVADPMPSDCSDQRWLNDPNQRLYGCGNWMFFLPVETADEFWKLARQVRRKVSDIQQVACATVLTSRDPRYAVEAVVPF